MATSVPAAEMPVMAGMPSVSVLFEVDSSLKVAGSSSSVELVVEVPGAAMYDTHSILIQ